MQVGFYFTKYIVGINLLSEKLKKMVHCRLLLIVSTDIY